VTQVAQVVKASARRSRVVKLSPEWTVVLDPRTQRARQCVLNGRTFRVSSQYLAHGTYGQVYKACRVGDQLEPTSDCDYVAKFIPLETPEDRQMFQVEAELSVQLSRAGVGPRVFQALTCESHEDHQIETGILILERYDDDVTNLRFTVKDFLQLHKLFDTLHEAGVVHGDTGARNILYKRLPGGQRQFALTDFGRSLPFNKAVPAVYRATDWVPLIVGMVHYNGTMGGPDLLLPNVQYWVQHARQKYGDVAWDQAVRWMVPSRSRGNCAEPGFYVGAVPHLKLGMLRTLGVKGFLAGYLAVPFLLYCKADRVQTVKQVKHLIQQRLTRAQSRKSRVRSGHKGRGGKARRQRRPSKRGSTARKQKTGQSAPAKKSARKKSKQSKPAR